MSRVFTIPPGEAFGLSLARGLLARCSDNPESLSRMLILLPTRRACRNLRETFLDLTNGKPLLLPRMKPLGEVDAEDLTLGWPDLEDVPGALDISPAIPATRRRILLARSILSRAGEGGWEAALSLADTLGHFLDQMLIEERDFTDLSRLVPDNYAEHWQITLDFLEILTTNWPKILQEQGCIDAGLRRRLLMEAQSQSWQLHPPAAPVIAAGSTGSIPVTARLLKVIAGLPQGEVILPGYDVGLIEGWESLEPSHPQYGFKQLFERMEIKREAVTIWPDAKAQEGRAVLAREIMRPAASVQRWMDLDPAALTPALGGIALIECDSQREEAGVIALALREALSIPGQTAALITPDRWLAFAVSQQCDRWNIAVDDSAGSTLDNTLPGSFLMLLLECAQENSRPAVLLALLKHPFCNTDPIATGFLESKILRGAKPEAGLNGIKIRFDTWRCENTNHPAEKPIEGLLGIIDPIMRPFLTLCESSEPGDFQIFLDAHLRMAEGFCPPETLWAGEAGEALAALMSELSQEKAYLGDLTAGDYAGLIASFIKGVTVRPRYGTHPRLMILGQLEARMIHADTVILGGLNEGTWPPDPGHDPWMSRPMRRDLGLPDPERSIGLAAHDFVQSLSAPRVILTRSLKKDGAPTVSARWLQRLETVLEAARIPKNYIQNDAYRQYFHLLDKPEESVFVQRPEPRPPRDKRPKKLSVTKIQTWMEDPYQIYARYVLNLKKLDPLEKPLDAAGRGVLLHRILERFVTLYPDTVPEGAQEHLETLAQETVRESGFDPGSLTFWWPRFAALAAWFIEKETLWRTEARPLKTEAKGSWDFTTKAGRNFTLHGYADRIDRMLGGQGYAVIDYKTGGEFSKGEMTNGKKPQLALEALMLKEGAFAGLPPGAIEALSLWVMKGGKNPGFSTDVRPLPEETLEQARSALEALVDSFADPSTPYTAQPNPDRLPAFNDYAHLARVKEWAVSSDEDGEEAA